jgi:hypothetical protein
MPRTGNGSKPARISIAEKQHRRRAEFFALPFRVTTPRRRHADTLLELLELLELLNSYTP